MATHTSTTSASTVVHTRKLHKRLPRNAREAVLSGFDLMEGFSSAEDTFTSANGFFRTGEITSEFTLPFTALIRCGQPAMPGCENRRGLPKNVRDAALRGYDPLTASYTAEDRFTGPHTALRTGQYEFEDGLVIPFSESIKFGRARILAA
jgi:hypothetical protein